MKRRIVNCMALALAWAWSNELAGASAAELFDGVDTAGQPIMTAAPRQTEEIRKGDFIIRFVKPDANSSAGTWWTASAARRLTRAC